MTGRVEQGESFSAAVHREVFEELGIQVQMDFLIGTTHLYRGEAIPENEMLGVQYCCSMDDSETIDQSAEHRWVAAEDIETLLPNTHWLANVIHRAEIIRSLASSELLNCYATNDFEV